VVAPASKWKDKDHEIEMLMVGCPPQIVASPFSVGMSVMLKWKF
jgi:hypothetical protein